MTSSAFTTVPRASRAILDSFKQNINVQMASLGTCSKKLVSIVKGTYMGLKLLQVLASLPIQFYFISTKILLVFLEN